MPHYHEHNLHNFCKQPQQPDFRFKISGFLAAVKLTDKSRYPLSGYPDMQTVATPVLAAVVQWYHYTSCINCK